MAAFLDKKKVFITNKDECFSYQVQNDTVIQNNEREFACHHEEADTRIVYHLSKLANNQRVMVEASDTDIFVIILGNIHKLETLQKI